MGYQIIAVSPDRPDRLKESVEKHQLNYVLASDSPMEAARAFGVAFQVDVETVERYRQVGVDLEEVSGEKHHLLPVPSVFIIGTEGIIRFQYVNPDYRVRLSADILLAAAREGMVGN